jgi:hypothetical protein
MLKNVYFISFFISAQRNLPGKTASIGFLILKNIDLLMFSLRMPMDVTPPAPPPPPLLSLLYILP